MGALMHLPDDLIAFLTRSQQLRYDSSRCECGQITLLPVESLQPGEIWINSDESPLADADPHKGDDGYYAISAVSLVATCDGYEPDYILLWLPEERMFGTWDSDHWDLWVFPKRTWTDITRDPLPYLNAQWDGGRRVAEWFVPWPRYPFKPGRSF